MHNFSKNKILLAILDQDDYDYTAIKYLIKKSKALMNANRRTEKPQLSIRHEIRQNYSQPIAFFEENDAVKKSEENDEDLW